MSDNKHMMNQSSLDDNSPVPPEQNTNIGSIAEGEDAPRQDPIYDNGRPNTLPGDRYPPKNEPAAVALVQFGADSDDSASFDEQADSDPVKAFILNQLPEQVVSRFDTTKGIVDRLSLLIDELPFDEYGGRKRIDLASWSSLSRLIKNLHEAEPAMRANYVHPNTNALYPRSVQAGAAVVLRSLANRWYAGRGSDIYLNRAELSMIKGALADIKSLSIISSLWGNGGWNIGDNEISMIEEIEKKVLVPARSPRAISNAAAMAQLAQNLYYMLVGNNVAIDASSNLRMARSPKPVQGLFGKRYKVAHDPSFGYFYEESGPIHPIFSTYVENIYKNGVLNSVVSKEFFINFISENLAIIKRIRSKEQELARNIPR